MSYDEATIRRLVGDLAALRRRVEELETLETAAGVDPGGHDHAKMVASDGDPDPAWSVDASGNLGAMTTDIESWSGFTTVIESLDTAIGFGLNTDIYIIGNAYYDGSWKYKTSDDATIYYQNQGTHIFARATSGTINNVISWLNVIETDTSGNVGFGVAPDNKCHIYKGDSGAAFASDANYGTLTIEHSSHAGINFLVPNNVSSAIMFGDADDVDVGYFLYDHATDKMTWGVGTNAAMILDAAGNLTVDVGYGTHSECFAGDAVGAIKRVRAQPGTVENGWGELDHATLPDGVGSTGKWPGWFHKKTGERMPSRFVPPKGKDHLYEKRDYDRPTYSLNKTIQINLRAIQQLAARLDELERPRLEPR